MVEFNRDEFLKKFRDRILNVSDMHVVRHNHKNQLTYMTIRESRHESIKFLEKRYGKDSEAMKEAQLEREPYIYCSNNGICAVQIPGERAKIDTYIFCMPKDDSYNGSPLEYLKTHGFQERHISVPFSNSDLPLFRTDAAQVHALRQDGRLITANVRDALNDPFSKQERARSYERLREVGVPQSTIAAFDSPVFLAPGVGAQGIPPRLNS